MFVIKDYAGEDRFIRLDSTETYTNGNMAVQVYDREGPYAKLSTNLPEKAPPGTFWLKDWSDGQHLAQQLIDRGYIEIVPEVEPVPSGFVKVRCARISGSGVFVLESFDQIKG